MEVIESGNLEGFNRASGSYIAPNATPHTIIHEVLHTLSSEFDKDGHRIKNGIEGDQKENFASQVNEGLTDYLAAKISGESPRHYIQGHKIFSAIEPLIQKYYNDEEILYNMYFGNKDLEFKKFLDVGLVKSGGGKAFYEKFLYLNENLVQQEMSKSINRKIKKENSLLRKIIERFKKATNRKNKTLLLNEGDDNYDERRKHSEFSKKYNTQYDGKITGDMKKRMNEYDKNKNNGRDIEKFSWIFL